MSILFRAIAALAFVCATLPPALADGWSIAAMNEQIDQTNFVVNRGCSGTLIDTENRYILTASHCVTDQYETVEIEEVADDGTITKKEVRRVVPGVVRQLAFDGAIEIRETSYRTKLLSVDKKKDLALLQVLAALPNTQSARMYCGNPVRGEPVFIVGNPVGVLYSSVVSGIISSTQRSYGTIKFGDKDAFDRPLMQVSGGVVGGNSGGAVYNANGDMIGVPVAANRTNEIIAFAVPLADIRSFLSKEKYPGVFAHCEAK